jgi:hypothetical protein
VFFHFYEESCAIVTAEEALPFSTRKIKSFNFLNKVCHRWQVVITLRRMKEREKAKKQSREPNCSWVVRRVVVSLAH